jgi:hypothetical protein
MDPNGRNKTKGHSFIPDIVDMFLVMLVSL